MIHNLALASGTEVPIGGHFDHVPQSPTYSEGYLPTLEGLKL